MNYYFDQAATTPPHPDVTRTIAEIMMQHYGNPSSLHQLGEASVQLLRKAREVCAEALDVPPRTILFTSGATESNNLAIKGAALQYSKRGRHIVTTAIEHASVYESVKQLEAWGYEITILPVDQEGRITPKQVLDAIRPDTTIVSVMHVNNEVGTIMPIQDIGLQLKTKYPRVLFHVDGVQGFGKVPLNIKGSGIDLYSLSAHKIYGPKGTGLLFVREGVQLTPLLSGGSQEHGFRAGTENVPQIVGMAKSMRMAVEGRITVAERMSHLKESIMDQLELIPELVINTPRELTAPHIINFSYPGMKGEVLLHMLEEAGFMVSTRSACSSKKSEPSGVLLAMGRTSAAATSGIRISLGNEHTDYEVGLLMEAIRSIVARLRHWKGGQR
ncbi:cysteine desulfurase [Paenibacillus shirakamiensis]|uniref:Cysteine desulfurase n=1 Tax=Paenibacillus shirakamiensis TaxID=1265935 RepID=A0ABS4JBU4_9BACL|nr:cysteine desulfurase [Paenibacillus shirakamiensis]